MAQELIPGNSLARAADRVRAKREAERTRKMAEEPITLNAAPVTTTTRVRARLNFIPDDTMLKNLVDQALTALARGVRWARGSIINLIV
jgi:hypothetical protein